MINNIGYYDLHANSPRSRKKYWKIKYNMKIIFYFFYFIEHCVYVLCRMTMFSVVLEKCQHTHENLISATGIIII